ncbi:MAG: hypothetical protein E6I88_09410 [Chloroflexi bacterium]|nr:MAG: hypothetical protein E6I88_09410 [Chloroflexota bacterium]
MAADAEGYGFKQGEEGLDRLFNDARVLSPAGIERAAWGWDRHEDQAALQGFHDAEREALRALEQADRINTWDAARKRALDLTEARSSLISWKAEHGELGHKAERALLGAALGILCGQGKDRRRPGGCSRRDQLAGLSERQPPPPWRDPAAT